MLRTPGQNDPDPCEQQLTGIAWWFGNCRRCTEIEVVDHIDHLDGTYTYTFAYDVTGATDPVTGASITYDSSLTHRLAIQLSGSINGVSLPFVNATYDFVPDDGELTHLREIVSTASCNECHGKLVAHGSRYETKYCVTCHNTGSTDNVTQQTVDFSAMVHGIHASDKRAGDGAAAYVIGNADFSEVTYPQDLHNCLKCHNGADSATPQGNAWTLHPSKNACGTCHATVDLSTHMGGQSSNANCAGRHTPSAIEGYHVTDNATPNNPTVPAGSYNFTYEIASVTASGSHQPMVNFRILKDGTPLNFASLPKDLTGSTTSPSFLVAHSQTNFQGSGTSLARHTVSVIKGVTGDPARRDVVDSAKCGNCHEWFEGHGGNRVYTVAVCSVCHNPNLSSSGRAANVANVSSSTAEALTAAGYDPTNPLTFPEASNDLKYLIHGIHASGIRESDYEFVRDRGSSGVFYYDFNEVTFPGELNNCQTCHLPGTYDSALPAGVMHTTDRTTDGTDVDGAAVAAARAAVPNSTDLVSTPTAAACYSCHTNELARAHIEDNGGAIQAPRDTLLTGDVETCDVCHGAGRTVDVELVHGL